MKPSKTHRILLVTGSLIAIAIGAAILFAPSSFQASYGIELGSNPNQLSETRAPGGALLALGLMMLPGAFASSFTRTSTSIAATVYLAYGASRLVSMALDGLPGEGIVAATVIELALGAAFAVLWARSAHPDERRSPATFVEEVA